MILAGDYHWGDVKALLPGSDTPYAEWYSSEDNEFPVYQVGVFAVCCVLGPLRVRTGFNVETTGTLRVVHSVLFSRGLCPCRIVVMYFGGVRVHAVVQDLVGGCTCTLIAFTVSRDFALDVAKPLLCGCR